MALTIIKDPDYAGVTHADKRAEKELSSQQTFHQEMWDPILFYQAPKWYMRPLLDKYAKKGSISADDWSWAEKGKWYKKQTVAVASDIGPGVVKLEFNNTVKYFVLKDVVSLGIKYPGSDSINLEGRVIATSVAGGGNQEATIQYTDTAGLATGINATDFPVDHEVSLLYNAHGECFRKPEGRFNNPDKFKAYLTKIDNLHGICDDGMNRLLWFKGPKGGKYWLSQDYQDLADMHGMAVDMAILFGQQGEFVDPDTNRPGVKGDGIITQLSKGSLTRGFAGSVTEDDHIEMLTDIGIHSGLQGTWKCICGPDFFRDSQKALKDYAVNGSFNFGPLETGKDGNTVGINIKKYQFGSKCVEMTEYAGFGDPDFLPQNVTGVNYRNFAMYLKMDQADIEIKYKKRNDAKIVKNWISTRHGQTMQGRSGGGVTLDEACKEKEITTHVGVAVKGLQKHGLMIGA